MAEAVADTVDALARPLAEAAGVDLVDVEVKGGGSRTRIRVVVDRKGGVDLATCQAISRDLGRAMDEADPVTGRYTLEVTSPGTDWPLGDQRAFDRVEGRTVKVILAERSSGPADEAAEQAAEGRPPRTVEVVGAVEVAGPHAVVLRDADGETTSVPYERIIKATQVLPW